MTTVYGIGTADGLNEKGSAGHMLYLTATDFGPRDEDKPGVHAGLWLQYLLDNAANVNEALERLDDVDDVQVVMTEARGRKVTVHLALEDASGDSAIVEYVKGERIVHHGRKYRIMTNDPTNSSNCSRRRTSRSRAVTCRSRRAGRNVSVPFELSGNVTDEVEKSPF